MVKQGASVDGLGQDRKSLFPPKSNHVTNSSMRPPVVEMLESRIAPANVIAVTNLKDNKTADATGGLAGSLFAAMTQANLTPDSVIKFGKYDAHHVFHPLKGTITLTTDLPAITADVTIDGAGITISGANKVRGLAITGGTKVAINGVTITKGLAQNNSSPTDASGGGLYVNDAGGAITLTGVKIKGNRAVGSANPGGTGYSVVGGGIDNEGGTLTIINSVITGNAAVGGAGGAGGYAGGSASGGGIFNGGNATLFIEATQITGNTATGGAGTAGVNATSDGNTASSGGGNGGGAYGGGIFDAGTVTIESAVVSAKTKVSVVSGNTATGGAGGAGGKGANGAAGTNFSSKTYQNNGQTYTNVYAPTAGSYGSDAADGGVGGSSGGGGVLIQGGSLTLTKTVVSGNTVKAGSGGAGGKGGNGGNGGTSGHANGYTYAAYGGSGGNAGNGGNSGATYGGGVGAKNAVTVEIVKSTVSGNTATAGAGGAKGLPGGPGTGAAAGTASKSYTMVDGSNVGYAGQVGNAGIGYAAYGGGLGSGGGTVTMQLSTFASNKATDGGGISSSADTAMSIHNCTIAMNKAGSSGGGLFVIDSTNAAVTVISTIIAQDSAGTLDSTYGADVHGPLNSASANNLIDANAHLGAFAIHDHGLMETYLPATGTTATTGGANPDTDGTDQNGVAFPSSGPIFIGAVQSST